MIGASPCLLLLFHLLVNILTCLLVGPALHWAHSLDYSWIRLMVLLRIYLGIVDPFFMLSLERIVVACIPKCDRCAEWYDSLVDFVCWCLYGQRRRRHHRQREGEERHFSDTDSDGDDGNNQNEAAEIEPANAGELIQVMNDQALA